MELNNGFKAKKILQWLYFHLKEFLSSLSHISPKTRRHEGKDKFSFFYNIVMQKTCVLFCFVLLRHLLINSAQYFYRRTIDQTSLSYLPHQILIVYGCGEKNRAKKP